MNTILEEIDNARGAALSMYRFHLQRQKAHDHWVAGFEQGAAMARRQELGELRRMRKQIVKILEEKETMDRPIEVTVKVEGQEWTLVGAYYDHEARAVSYEDISGNCVRYLPAWLRDKIEGEATIAAYQQEQERQQEAAEARYDR